MQSRMQSRPKTTIPTVSGSVARPKRSNEPMAHSRLTEPRSHRHEAAFQTHRGQDEYPGIKPGSQRSKQACAILFGSNKTWVSRDPWAAQGSANGYDRPAFSAGGIGSMSDSPDVAAVPGRLDVHGVSPRGDRHVSRRMRVTEDVQVACS